MKLLYTILLLIVSVSLNAKDVKTVKSINIYTDNVLMLKEDQVKDCKYIDMDADDALFINSILSTTSSTSYSPVTPSPGGLFCVICFDTEERISVRVTHNVIVKKRVDNNQESFRFYAPNDKEQLVQLALLLDKYK